MQPAKNPNPCVAAPTTQGQSKNHRQCPVNTEPFGLRALWLHFANHLELKRLAKLHVRIELKKANLADLIAERQAIMNRCIRRMRRAKGKN
ncbi:hypothetical protein [Tritonibacter horizontis]|uniref:Uncharacterized protein n=1 Tax=Tritonibacter horizontis TaxID=1768241 RepID=A0A132BRB6_9RHOB|nr:hypothetical protein [Tritonibacter horizontis]KUP90938.1 hypothetical protein TRIHO_42950 [Tritonibacter horizontis]